MFVKEGIEIVAGTVRGDLHSHFSRKKSVALAQIAKFREDLVENPGKAMEWADSQFEAVAKAEVAGMAIFMLNHYNELSTVRLSLHSSMRDKARYINNKSTSVSSNLMKECMIAELVQALEHLEHFV